LRVFDLPARRHDRIARRVFLRDMGGRRARFQPLKPLGAGLSDALGAPARWSHAVLNYVGAVVADTAENCPAAKADSAPARYRRTA
jgi:hypothetical protein